MGTLDPIRKELDVAQETMSHIKQEAEDQDERLDRLEARLARLAPGPKP